MAQCPPLPRRPNRVSIDEEWTWQHWLLTFILVVLVGLFVLAGRAELRQQKAERMAERMAEQVNSQIERTLKGFPVR